MKTSFYVVTVLASASVAACGMSKVEQCNSFVDHVTKAQTAVEALDLDSEDPEVLKKGGSDVTAAAQSLGSLELKDDKLAGYHKSYTEILHSMGKVVTDLGAVASDAKDEAKAEAATTKANQLIETANQLEKKESDLVDEVNKYCTGSE